VLCDLAMVRIRVTLGSGLALKLGSRLGLRSGSGFRSKIRKLHMRDFEIARHILQVAQVDKSRAVIKLPQTIDGDCVGLCLTQTTRMTALPR